MTTLLAREPSVQPGRHRRQVLLGPAVVRRRPVSNLSAAVEAEPARRVDSSYLGLGLDAQTDDLGQVVRLHGLGTGGVVEIRLFPLGSGKAEPSAARGSSDVESATWVLAVAPAFDTVLGGWSSIPKLLTNAIGDVPVAAPIWQGLHVYGGEFGLVAVRRAGAPLPFAFLHDLWLLERIAAGLSLLPLPAGDLAAEPLPADRGGQG